MIIIFCFLKLKKNDLRILIQIFKSFLKISYSLTPLQQKIFNNLMTSTLLHHNIITISLIIINIIINK